MRYLVQWLGVCVCASLGGCGPKVTEFGKFDGKVVASWDDDGRNMTLTEKFAYIDASKKRWDAPKGAVVNGASIPKPFWSIIGGPFEGQYHNASVVHDVYCENMKAPWQDVHKMFYEACRCGGCPERKSKLMYYAVYNFGPRWHQVYEFRVGDDGEKEKVAKMAREEPDQPLSRSKQWRSTSRSTIRRLKTFLPWLFPGLNC